jgi:hypothetical protein
MAIVQTPCTSFKQELAQGVHNFSAVGGDAFKLALYTSAATLGATTTVYTSAGEASGTGYSAGGIALTNVGVSTSGVIAYLSFVSPAVFTGVTLTCRGALIYNSSKSNKAVCVLDFGDDISALGQNLNVTFPPVNLTSAIIRIN